MELESKYLAEWINVGLRPALGTTLNLLLLQSKSQIIQDQLALPRLVGHTICFSLPPLQVNATSSNNIELHTHQRLHTVHPVAHRILTHPQSHYLIKNTQRMAASTSNVVSLLQNGLAQDAATRTAAGSALEALQASDYPSYLQAMASILAGDDHPSTARNGAGLAIKNALYAKEQATQDVNARRWREAIDDTVRNAVKEASLATLSSNDRAARNVAGQAVAAVARLELAQSTQPWPQLIPSLLSAVTLPTSTPQLRQAALQALGFVCESVVSR